MSQSSNDAILSRGLAFQQAGRLAEAEAAYQAILQGEPTHSDALHLLGMVRWQAGRYSEAISLIENAIRQNPTHPAFHSNLGLVFISQGQFAKAVTACREAVRLAPQFANAQGNLGAALANAGEPDEGIAHLQEAVRLSPDFGMAWLNLGKVLHRKRRMTEAVAALRQACRCLGASQATAEARIELGKILVQTVHAQEAFQEFQAAIALCGSSADLRAQALNGAGVGLNLQGRFDEAAEKLREALALAPGFAPAAINLANSLSRVGMVEEAVNVLTEAQRRAPDDTEAHSALVYLTMYDPRFDEAAIRRELDHWRERHTRSIPIIHGHRNDRSADRRLRVGYVSPDFRNHAADHLLLPLIENHDVDRFEVFCYSNVTVVDDVTDRFRRAASGWRDIRALDDVQAAQQIQQDSIDILVDMSLHMAGNRLLIFARKPAPIQVTWMAYPGSTGLRTIDFRLTDRFLDPPGSPEPYIERSIRLPGSFWCYDPPGMEIPVNSLPAQTAGRVTFGCLSNPVKVNADVLELWARVLNVAANSRLVLLVSGERHAARIRDFFAMRGVAGERLRFVPPQPREDYLKVYHDIDVGLDTFPYNGHITSMDSFWMGVPVITLVGKTVVGRAGLSQLSNLGLTEFVASTGDEYVNMAVTLASDWARLAEIRAMLRKRMQSSVLMDAKGFCHGIEEVWRSIWREWCASAF